MENALGCDVRIEKLIKLLINGYSSSSNDGELGGLARGLRNSPKLAGLLREEQQVTIRTTDEILGKLHSFRFAPQRFGTLCDVATHIVLNIRSLFNLLLKVNNSWSERLLAECFQAKSLLLLALIAEFASCCMRYVRKLDAGDASGDFMAPQVSRAVHQPEDELDSLFSFKSGDHVREPLVLNKNFSMGYVQILSRELLGDRKA